MDRQGSSNGGLLFGKGLGASTTLRHQSSPSRAASHASSTSNAGAAAAGHVFPANGGNLGRSPGAAGSSGPGRGRGGQAGPGRPGAWKGHLGGYSTACRLSAAQLLCLGLLLLLLLPLGFLVQVHVLRGSGSAAFLPAALHVTSLSRATLRRHSPGGSGTASSSSSSSSSSIIDSELPSADGGSAGAGVTAAVAGELACIPPSRATSWQQVDDELRQGSHAATAAVSLQDQIKQDLERLVSRAEQQQQQQQPPRSGLTQVLGMRKLQQQGSDVVGSQGFERAAGPTQHSTTLKSKHAAAAAGAAGIAAGAAVKTDASARPGQRQQQQQQQQWQWLSHRVLAAAGLPVAATTGANLASNTDYYDYEAAAADADYAAVAAGAEPSSIEASKSTKQQQQQQLPGISPSAVDDYYDAEAAAADAPPLAGLADAVPFPGSSSGHPDAALSPPSEETPGGLGPPGPSGSPHTAGSPAASSAAPQSSTAPVPAADDEASSATPAAAADSSGAAGPAKAPATAVAAVVDKLDISLVNDVEFHHEVTLGLMAALQKHKSRVKVYVHDSVFRPAKPGSSSFNFLKYTQTTMPGFTLRNAYYKPSITKTDVAIFVSPEFSIDYYRDFIRRATPRMLIIFIHEPDMELRRLQYIINMHPLVGVVALSPHVADTVRSRMRMHHVHWMMPVMPVECTNSCWEGFAVQGKFEGSRRSYKDLWEAMQHQLQAQQLLHPAKKLLAYSHLSAAPGSASSATAYNADEVKAVARHVQHAGAADLVSAGDTWRSVPHLTAHTAHVAGLLHLAQDITMPSGVMHHVTSRRHLLAQRAHRALSYRINGLAQSGNGTASHPRSGWAIGLAAGQGSLPSGSRQVRQHSQHGLPAAGAGAQSLPRINVMGSGQVALLGVPVELRPWVHLYRDLGYEDYYDTLCRSRALLPLFNASGGYLEKKISSSVLTSVAVGLPMIVPAQFLKVYSIFQEDHVFVLADDDKYGMQLMETLAAPSADAKHASKRSALTRLRLLLNSQATAKLEGLMAAAQGRPHATTKQD